MQKVTLSLGAAIVAFLIGTAAASFNPHRQTYHAAESVATEHTDIKSVVQTANPQQWREIKIGQVSFKIPAQLKNTGLPGNAGIVEAFRGDVNGLELYVNYAYGRNVPWDANPPAGLSRDVMINGKRGILSVWEYDPNQSLIRDNVDSSIVELFLPNLGDGKDKFELYASSLDLNIAKRVIDTVEVR